MAKLVKHRPGGAAALWLAAAAVGSAALVGPAAAVPPRERPATRPVTTHPASMPAIRLAASRPATVPSPADIEALVRQLAGPTFNQRQSAQDRLVDLGELVEARLHQVITDADNDEAVGRAQAALHLIQENRLVGPTLVTLDLDDAPAPAAIKALARAAHTPLPTEPDDLWKSREWPHVTCHADHQPFWAVLRDVCRQVGLDAQFDPAGKLRLSEGDAKWGAMPSAVSGPFLVQASDVSRERTINFADPAAVDDVCDLTLVAYAEPKLRVLRDSGTVTLDTFVDEQGRSLKGTGTDADGVLAPDVEGGHSWQLLVSVTQPPGAGHKIARISGTLEFLVPVKMETTEVPDLATARNQQRTVAGHRFTVRRLRKDGQGAYEVQVTVYRDNLSDEQWQQMGNPQDYVWLLDEKGRVLNFVGVGENQGGDKEMTYVLHFEGSQNGPGGPGKPVKMVWEVPTEIKVLRIPFRFNDLPLP